MGSSGWGGGTPDPSLAGTWSGYIENYYFPSQSDSVVLVVETGVPTGHAVFGSGTAPPPATDGNVGYPPNLTASGGSAGYYVYEGFEYTMRLGNVTDARVRFKLSTSELWSSWCPLETPYDWGGGNYGCVPNWGWSSDGQTCLQTDPQSGAVTSRDCTLLTLCTSSSVCSCTATACSANLQDDIQFDLHHLNDALDGSIAGTLGDHNVHLMRQ